MSNQKLRFAYNALIGVGIAWAIGYSCANMPPPQRFIVPSQRAELFKLMPLCEKLAKGNKLSDFTFKTGIQCAEFLYRNPELKESLSGD